MHGSMDRWIDGEYGEYGEYGWQEKRELEAKLKDALQQGRLAALKEEELLGALSKVPPETFRPARGPCIRTCLHVHTHAQTNLHRHVHKCMRIWPADAGASQL